MKPAILFITFAFSQALSAGTLKPASGDTSLCNEVQIAIDKGLAWLQKSQNADGTWSLADYPAQTALPLAAFMLEPTGRWRKEKPAFIQNGYAALLKAAHPDGGIYVKGLANYNTSISIMALAAAGDPGFDRAIRAARDFVVGQQAKNMIDSDFDGGIGYGPVGTSSGNPDLSNTAMALEALRVSRRTANPEGHAHTRDLNWKAVVEFIQRCQNLPGSSKGSASGIDADDLGGFVYAPGSSKAGETKSSDGRAGLRSYGSMSYAGLLSYIYSDVHKDDPRVQAVVRWARNHYTLDENPGMGMDGLYYYYCMMAKALNAYGARELEMADGRRIDWRRELALKLINLQKADGSWSNESGRWMEKDPTLVTSYTVLALEYVYHSY